ncbi:MAG TPA: MerR family transcriptional regulator [Kofleriaceae bacterium]|nr:MerR family transcriptional regulator [Kofleriaceae bacterium]
MSGHQPQPTSYTVGELARMAGVSVRTLHHYEAIRLLVPSGRTEAGHRRYARSDLARLARIRGLTALGFSLEQARACLEDEAWSPLRLIEDHLARAREALAEQQELCERLERLREQVARGGDDVEHFIETVEVMTMIESYYTPEQREALARRREELGDDAIRRVEDEWQALFAEVKAELDRATPPGAPAAQALARRWRELTTRTMAGFTGGDPGITASLKRMYAEQPVDRIHPSMDPVVFAFMKEACDLLE